MDKLEPILLDLLLQQYEDNWINPFIISYSTITLRDFNWTLFQSLHSKIFIWFELRLCWFLTFCQHDGYTCAGPASAALQTSIAQWAHWKSIVSEEKRIWIQARWKVGCNGEGSDFFYHESDICCSCQLTIWMADMCNYRVFIIDYEARR